MNYRRCIGIVLLLIAVVLCGIAAVYWGAT